MIKVIMNSIIINGKQQFANISQVINFCPVDFKILPHTCYSKTLTGRNMREYMRSNMREWVSTMRSYYILKISAFC